MPPTLWTVTARSPLAARWRNLSKKSGVLSSQRLDSISSLLQAGGAGAEGIALVDADLLLGQAGEHVRTLRKHCPGVQLLIVCEESSLQGPDLADALASGALDYLRAVRSDDILIDKIRTHIKRLFPALLEVQETRFKDLKVDWRCRAVEVRAASGWKEVEALTPKEFDLLRVLIEYKGRRVSREALLDLVWKSRAASVNPESVDKQIGSLRRKLGDAGKRIQTIRGFGYALKG